MVQYLQEHNYGDGYARDKIILYSMADFNNPKLFGMTMWL